MKETREARLSTVTEPEMNSMEDRVRRLEQERKIREILLHYTRCVDRGDFEGIASCYTEDGAFYPSDKTAPIKGKTAILSIFRKLMNPLPTTSMHYITNQQVLFISDVEALVFAYFYSNKSFAGAREDENTWGGYELRVVLESDLEWRIKTHKCFFTRQTGSQTSRSAENRGRPWPPFPEHLIDSP